jgi:hypothetical protein
MMHPYYICHSKKFYVSCGADLREAMKYAKYPMKIYCEAVYQAVKYYKLLEKLDSHTQDTQMNWKYVALTRVTTGNDIHPAMHFWGEDPRIQKLGTFLLNHFKAYTANAGCPIPVFYAEVMYEPTIASWVTVCSVLNAEEGILRTRRDTLTVEEHGRLSLHAHIQSWIEDR